MPVVISKALGTTHGSECSQEEELLIATVCFLFPLRLQFLYSYFQGIGPQKKAEELRGKRGGGKGGGDERRYTVRRETKHRRRKRASEKMQREEETPEGGAKSQMTKSLSVCDSTPTYAYVPCANISSQRRFVSWAQGWVQCQ